MQFSDTFRPRNDNVASEDFDGEFVVLDFESGKYFSLAGGAAIVWRGLLSGHSVETLTAGLPETDARRGAVVGIVESLLGYGLLAPATELRQPDPDLPAELAGSTAEFVIEAYDDLAQLLVADPIHEVDETVGWPHLPAGKRSA